MIPDQVRTDAQLLWDYHHMGHEVRPCSVLVGLGSHDLGVADVTADLYHRGMAPLIVFTGATSPTTRGRMPRGEAVHYRERAIELGVPADAVLVEPRARNTGENITFTRALLANTQVDVESVLLVTKPYEERRAYATACKLWPEVQSLCGSSSESFEQYVVSIGDTSLVIDMLVGALQRLLEYPVLGFTTPQEVPTDARSAYERLCKAGFTHRLMRTGEFDGKCLWP